MGRLKFTLKAWPVIAIATIGLCLVTQVVAKLFGVDLPDQQNVGAVREIFLHAFDSSKHLANCIVMVLTVLAIMPAIEEVVFRWLLVMLPKRIVERREAGQPTADRRHPEGTTNDGRHTGALDSILVFISSVLFSAAHYVKQPFPDAAFVALFFFGLAQCWLYFKTDRLWCPMLNHALFNLTNMVLIFIVPA